jgi:nucleotide-binding universal stress UspA family protein
MGDRLMELEHRDKVLRKILIATDGSETAKKAAEFGVQIAGLSGAKVYAVFVIDTTPYYSIPLDQIWSKEVYEQLEKMGSEITLDVEKTAKIAGLEAESVVLKGNPAEMIVNFAEEQNVDMIIVGAHGMGGFERLVIGSVSEKIVRHSKSPVLVVREWKEKNMKND